MAGGSSGRWKMGLTRAVRALLWSQFSSRKLAGLLAKPNEKDLDTLRDLMAAGKVTPVIDRHYKLNEVPEAIRYLEEGHARGKVVITL
jgi:NADPH:quinone reductase-like Zn-dependent oxidoreductase